jgi:O-methyltransferase
MLGAIIGDIIGSPYEFDQIWSEICGRTPMPKERAKSLYGLVLETMGVAGDMAECGTYQGASAKLICRATNHTTPLHVFDTFAGIPAEQRKPDEHSAGDFTCSQQEVEAFLSDCKAIQIYPGLVPDTLEAVRDKRFSFVNLDMDLYRPTIAALHFFWFRMSPGGIIVLDDVENLYGVRDALVEFALFQRLKPVSNTADQAYIRKE